MNKDIKYTCKIENDNEINEALKNLVEFYNLKTTAILEIAVNFRLTGKLVANYSKRDRKEKAPTCVLKIDSSLFSSDVDEFIKLKYDQNKNLVRQRILFIKDSLVHLNAEINRKKCVSNDLLNKFYSKGLWYDKPN